MRIFSAVLFSAFLLFSSFGYAQDPKIERYEFDKAHTQILFFVDHLGFSKSQGEFHDYDGFIELDRENPQNSKVEVTIKTSSIDMDDEKWDESMKSAKFFDVEKYPSMTFKSTSVELNSENVGKVTGDLTILDDTKPVILNVTHNKSGTHPFSGRYVAGFSADTTINRTDWGMDYGVPGVGQDVNIRLEVEAMKLEDKKLNQ